MEQVDALRRLYPEQTQLLPYQDNALHAFFSQCMVNLTLNLVRLRYIFSADTFDWAFIYIVTPGNGVDISEKELYNKQIIYIHNRENVLSRWELHSLYDRLKWALNDSL